MWKSMLTVSIFSEKDPSVLLSIVMTNTIFRHFGPDTSNID